MKTEVIVERPAFTLQGSSYNGVGEVVEVSRAEGTSDEPNHTEWKAKPKLKWFAFA